MSEPILIAIIGATGGFFVLVGVIISNGINIPKIRSDLKTQAENREKDYREQAIIREQKLQEQIDSLRAANTKLFEESQIDRDENEQKIEAISQRLKRVQVDYENLQTLHAADQRTISLLQQSEREKQNEIKALNEIVLKKAMEIDHKDSLIVELQKDVNALRDEIAMVKGNTDRLTQSLNQKKK